MVKSYKHGSEICLANGLGRLLSDRGHLDEEALKLTVSNYEELKEHLAEVDLAKVIASTGLSQEALEQAADILGEAKNVAIVFGSDISKSAFGLSKSSAVANLAILSGAIGSNGGLYPLDDKGNTQGVLDMGVYPEALPGFQPYDENKQKFAAAWRCELPEAGLDADGILQEIEAGKVRFLYLAAANLLNFPNSKRWLKALEKVEVLVAQDIFPTEITKLATVVLPGCTFAEKSGSFTALDKTVRSIKPALRPLGQSREDGAIFAELFGRLTKTAVNYSCVDLNAEINELTSLYADVECGDDVRRTCVKKPFVAASQGLRYQLISAADATSGLQLLTGTSASHFGTTSMWAANQLEVEPEGMFQLNKVDADAVGAVDGDKVKFTSSVGATVSKVTVTDSVPQGLVFAPNNFMDLGAQQLVADGDNQIAIELKKV